MRSAVSTLILLFVAQCVFAQASITKEEYGIYSLVLREYMRFSRKQNQWPTDAHILILSKAGMDVEEWPTSKSSVEVSFLNRNKVPAPVEPFFQVNFRYSIVDEKEILDLIAKDQAEFNEEQERRRKANTPLLFEMCGPSWKRIDEKYPDFVGYLRLSRIGFSRDHKTAYVALLFINEVASGHTTYTLNWTRSGWRIGPSGAGMSIC